MSAPNEPAGASVPGMGGDTLLGDNVAPEPDRNAPPALLAAAGRALASPAGQQVAGTIGSNLANQAMQPKQSQPPLQGVLNTLGAMGAPPEPLGNSRYAAGANMAHHRYSASSDSLTRENAEMDDEMNHAEVEQYAAENETLRQQNSELAAELDRVSAHNESILTEQAEHYAALQHQVVALTQDKTDTSRKGRISELAGRFPVVNVEEECERCLYSAGAEMTDEDFDAHLATIERYAAQTIPTSPMIPVGVAVGEQNVESARYEAQAADMARDIINDTLRKGERISYPDALAKAKESLGQQ